MNQLSLLAGYRHLLEVEPSKTAFVLDTRRYTFADLETRVAVLRQAFGQRKQLRVAIALPNSVDVACWYIACVAARQTLILMDPEWPLVTREAALELVQPDVVVTSEGVSVSRRDCRAVVNPDRVNDDAFDFLAGFTSGSSGQPKAFLRDSQSWLASFQCSACEFGVSADTVQLAPGPLSHGLSFYAMAESLHAGATFMSQSAFDVKACLSALHVRTPAVNNLVVVPTMLQRLLDANDAALNKPPERHKSETAEPLQFSTIVAGAKLGSRLKQRYRNTWPAARLSEYYGASELSFVSVNHDHEQRPDDSVGRLCSGVSVTTFDSTGGDRAGEDLQAASVGTLHVRSAMLARGYLRQNATGLATVPLEGRDGWCTVGDRGWLDDKGSLYLTDREDRMLISGGLNVYPSRVEVVISDALHSSAIADKLEQCVVLGMPDRQWGEQIVVILAGHGLAPQLLAKAASIQSCLTDCYALYLQKHEMPRRVFIADSLPLTSSGKVAYRELPQLLPGLAQLTI